MQLEQSLTSALANPEKALIELDRVDCADSLSRFIKLAWPMIEPGRPYVHGWHIDALSEHLMAVTDGEISRLIINVPPGTMKAIDSNQPVWTTEGWKRHGDLQVNDYVFGPDGLPKRVENTTIEVLEDSYRVEFDDGSTVVAGSGHEWLVEREYNDKSTKWKRERRSEITTTPNMLAKNNIKGHQRQDRIPCAEAVKTVSQYLPIDPYLLGAWLGDGFSNGGTICVSSEDKDFLHHKIGGEIKLVREKTERGQAFYRIRIDGLSTRLRVCNLLNNKHVPEYYLRGSAEQRLELLRGLMDTDGHASKQGDCLFTNKNKNIADAVFFIAASLGMKPRIKEKRSILNGKDYGVHYLVSFWMKDAALNPFSMPRKAGRVGISKSKRSFCRYVKTLTPVGKRIVKCIQVEGGLYLVGKSFVTTHNSLSVGVFWPMWEWGPRGLTHYRYLGMSHAERLSIRDNLRCKRLVNSEWYQHRWPIPLMADQNAKIKFENERYGYREALSITSATGSRGDRVIVDDPHSVNGSDSEAKRENVCDDFFEGVSNRLNDESKNSDGKESAIIVVMQRLHERDLSGQILARDMGYEHLCLPMEYEADRQCKTIIGFSDPREKDGELLFPSRFDKAAVERSKKTLGSYAAAGQLQQRPAPREGGMFKVGDFNIIDRPDFEREATVRYWDKAGTAGGGAYTAGVKMSRLTDGSYLIEHVERGQWSAGKRETNILRTAENDGAGVAIWMEQEPGSSGKDVAQLSIRNLAGFNARADRVSGKGSKEVRAEPYAAQVEGGNVYLLKGDWNDEFIREHGLFPNGTYKDQVDASAGAFSKLVKAQKKPDLNIGGGKSAAIRL